ncbi:MAG: L,D-transpeptidase [Qingshengfaniella sp.]
MTQGYRLTRRAALAGGLTALAAPALAQDLTDTDTETARRNIAGFRAIRWQDHFDSPGKTTLIADTRTRTLHYWNAEGTGHRVFPSSVPLTEELTKRGYTEVVRKKTGPDWTPTPSMVQRNPDLHYIPAGPDSPLGSHALYLSWPAYLIHGTHDTRKIGRPSSDGCIGLYNEAIAELYEVVPIGAQVRII